jgi:hypothetical protein
MPTTPTLATYRRNIEDSAVMPKHLRPALAGLLASLLLSGCADKPTRPVSPPGTASAAAKSNRDAATTRHHRTTKEARVEKKAEADEKLPANTGIAACDDYLASYRACHRAAQIYPPDQIEMRYEMMRHSLLRDSLDPNIRPQLAERCNALAGSLRQALHGKSCAAEPPAEDSSAGN